MRNNGFLRRALKREHDRDYEGLLLQRCDVLLTHRITDVNPETIVIELKAAGVRRTPKQLFNGVRSDIAKIYSADLGTNSRQDGDGYEPMP